jgi:hypothetical protein
MKILSAKTKILLGMIFTLMICLMFAGCSNSDTTSDSRGFTDFEHIEEVLVILNKKQTAES